MKHTIFNMNNELTKELTKVVRAYLDVTLLSLKNNYDMNIIILDNSNMITINVSLGIEKSTLSLIDNFYFTANSLLNKSFLFENAKSIIYSIKDILFNYLQDNDNNHKELLSLIDSEDYNKKLVLKILSNYRNKSNYDNFGYYCDNEKTFFGVNIMFHL